MKKSEQTESVKVELFNLTRQFVYKYVWRYYKQFQGDLDDLVMDYYVEFLTPKSRVQGKEQSLLDKFDDKVTTLPYLVKIAVQRKLIDSSRQDPIRTYGLDLLSDEYGDCITEAFNLTTSQDEIIGHIEDFRDFSRVEVAMLKKRFMALTEEAQDTLRRQFNEAKAALNPSYREVLQEILVDMY